VRASRVWRVKGENPNVPVTKKRGFRLGTVATLGAERQAVTC